MKGGMDRVSGTEAEPVPVEILGPWKNAQMGTIILGNGRQAQRTNVAGGMSGSPVYVDGKLMGRRTPAQHFLA
jgi:hypothetical protein